jgi:proton-translocating NADH-quinone oxidoreductase chain N
MKKSKMNNFIYSEILVSAVLLQDFSEKSQISGDLAPLKSFALLPEYLLSVTVLYGVLLSTWVTGHSYNLMIQKTFSETFGLVMLMVCFLYYNNMLCSFSHTFTRVVISINYSFYKSILNGELAIVAKFVICFISAIFFFVSAYSLTEQKLTASEYSILLAFSMLGLLLLCNGNDLLTIYLSIELAALASYALASFKKTHCSSESGLKYFVVGSISSSFFLLGSSFLYLEANSIYFVDFNRLFEYNRSLISESINISFLDISIAFILVSLFTKLACAPFHLWALNVYEESPTSSSFYFATVTKLSTIILIIRLAFHTFFTICFVWVALFIVVGIISALMGALGGIRQKKFKTMLAYSSTSNVGYALVALGGLTDTAIWAVFFHIIIYQFTSLCLWTLLLIARLRLRIQTCKYNKEIADLSLFKKSSLPVVF